jgi:hypothetical protein
LNINESLPLLKIIFQLIKDSYGTRKLLKGFLPNRKSTGQKKINNKIHTAHSDLYRKSFPNSDSPENLPQHRKLPLESSGKVLAQ